MLWEWNKDQCLFTARVAGQFAKVTKLTFAVNGNKFAAVDGDGHLCIWQATQQMQTKKPFFVRFIPTSFNLIFLEPKMSQQIRCRREIPWPNQLRFGNCRSKSRRYEYISLGYFAASKPFYGIFV
jgi:hypothetical protein